MNQLHAMSKRKRLLEDLHLELGSVENAIQQVTTIKSNLEEEANKVKAEIRRNFSSHVEHLRGREEQLIRQVEVLATKQTSLLHTQFAKLYHSLGWLQSAVKSTEEDRMDSENVSFSGKDLECVKRMTMQDIPSFSVMMDDCALKTAIEEFGRVEVFGTLLSFNSPEASSCLPNQFEEYEEEKENHHVMHKTLQDVDFGKKLSLPTSHTLDMKEWLVMREKNSEYNKCNSNKNNFQVHTPDHRETWLHTPKENKEQEEDGFQMIDGLSCATSDSIEVISTPQCPSPYETVFTIGNNIREEQWLSQKKETNSDCRCGASNTEIENLSKLDCCMNDSMQNLLGSRSEEAWLASYSLNEEATIPTALLKKISKICLANETCSSFNECVCDDNCAVRWLQKPRTEVELDRGRSDGVDKTTKLLEPMMKILYAKDEDYLSAGRSKDSNGNVKKNEKPNVRECVESFTRLFDSLMVDNVTNWLHPDYFNRSKDSGSVTGSVKSCDNSMWLRAEGLGANNSQSCSC